MFVAVGSHLAYFQLLTIDAANTDPSDMLNLIDQARAEVADSANANEVAYVQAKCQSVELDVHLTFTPPALALVCCE